MLVEENVDTLGRRAAEQLLADGSCRTVEYRRAIASTNTAALDQIRSGQLLADDCPKLFLADSQPAGRGRHGRSWASTDGTLTMSMVIDRPTWSQQEISLIPLAVGIGVARTLEFHFAPLTAKLKWPNDVHIDGGKVAGILLETTQRSSQMIVVGIGINVGELPDLGDDPAAASIRSVSDVIGRNVHRYEFLRPLVTQLLATVDELEGHRDEVLEEFRSRCLLTGATIRYQDREEPRDGICKGIDDNGALIVETSSGISHVQSGEASIVRRN